MFSGSCQQKRSRKYVSLCLFVLPSYPPPPPSPNPHPLFSFSFYFTQVCLNQQLLSHPSLTSQPRPFVIVSSLKQVSWVNFHRSFFLFPHQTERKFSSQLQNFKDRLEQSHSTNRSMQNYVQFLKNSYSNVFGDTSFTTSSPYKSKSPAQLFWWQKNRTYLGGGGWVRGEVMRLQLL